MSVDNKLDKSKEHFYNNHQQQTIKKTPHKVLRYVRDNRQRYDNGYTIQDVYRNSSQLALKKEKAAALYSSSSTNNHKQNLRSYNKSKGIGFITETSKPRSAESSKVTNTHRNIKHNNIHSIVALNFTTDRSTYYYSAENISDIARPVIVHQHDVNLYNNLQDKGGNKHSRGDHMKENAINTLNYYSLKNDRSLAIKRIQF